MLNTSNSNCVPALGPGQTHRSALQQQAFAALAQLRDYAIVLVDTAQHIAGWNGGAERLLGYSATEAVGQPLDLLFAPEDVVSRLPARELDAAARDGQATSERWQQRHDGSRFFARVVVTAVCGPDGERLGYILFVHDLTDRRRAEEQLASSEARHRQLVESINDYAIFTLDREGVVNYWTTAAERILGYTSAEVVGRPFAIFFPRGARYRGEPERELEAAADAGRTERAGWRIRKDGTLFWAEEVMTALHDPAGALIGFSKITRDSTDRRRAELERERLLKQAAEGSRLKDEFLSTVSHELRTPLNAILGWTHLLQIRKSRPQSMTEGLAIIERNAKAQARLIDDLLDMSRILSGKTRLALERVALADPLQAAVETVRPMAEQKGIMLVVHYERGRDWLMADGVRLQQVIWNVLTNAIKFTPAGGIVVVTSELSDAVIELSVRDSGVGIDGSFLPLVFDRFRQADHVHTREHDGLGLGLSIVKHLVERHGGHVAIDSAGRGHGTTVRLTLPRALDGAPDSLPVKPARAQISRALRDVRVLVVDDDADSGQILALVLTAQGAHVVRAASTREAVAALGDAAPQVVLTDLSMPGDDGFELLRQVRASHHESVRVIAITGHARPEDRERCLAAGFDGYLTKPLDLDRVVEVVAGRHDTRVR